MLYAILSVPKVQNIIRDYGENELSTLIGADVTVGGISIAPFNKLTLNDIYITTAPGDTALKVKRLGAGIRLGKLIMQRKIVISYAEIIGLEGNIWRDSVNAPLNIQPIIDHLRSDNKDKPQSIYDLKINNIVIRQSSIRYDVNDAPHKGDAGTFDKNHLNVHDLRADIQVPRINNDDYRVIIRRLALREGSGLSIESISGEAYVTSSGLNLKGFNIQLPNSSISLSDMRSPYDGWEMLTKGWTEIPIDIQILRGSHIYPADLSPLVPALKKLNMQFDISMSVKGTVDDMTISDFRIAEKESESSVSIINLHATGLPSIEDMAVKIENIEVDTNTPKLSKFLQDNHIGNEKLWAKLDSMGTSQLLSQISMSPSRTSLSADFICDAGSAKIKTELNGSIIKLNGNFIGSAILENADLGIAHKDLGQASLNMDFKGNINKKLQWVKVDAIVDAINYKGYEYSSINTLLTIDKESISGTLSVEDENIIAYFDGELGHKDGDYSCNAKIDVKRLNLNSLNLTDKYPGYNMSARIESTLRGSDFENLDGRLAISNFEFTDSLNQGIGLGYMSVKASGTTNPRYMLIHSDILDGRINGNYKLSNIVPTAQGILEDIFPALVHRSDRSEKIDQQAHNAPLNLSARLELRENSTTHQWLDFFKSPVNIMHPVSITAVIDEESKLLKASVDAPHLLQKDKFIDNTVLIFKADGNKQEANLDLSTLYPTKNGDATINLTANGHNNRFDTKLNWDIKRERKFNGKIDVSTFLSEHTPINSEKTGLAALIKVNPTEMTFNDTVWEIHPSTIDIVDKCINVKNFEVSRDNQYVKIDGTASDNNDDKLCLQLLDMNLDYVFETLDIGSAMFGGIASGKFYASNLFSKQPKLETPGLHVNGFKYNFSKLGDADIVSYWNNETKGIVIDAEVTGNENNLSTIHGAIYPMKDSLDFKFKADRLPVGFMKPFMEAFTSDVSGIASGDAHLYGTFKYINLSGDIFAQDLKLKVDVTNTYYTTTDSIHIKPGRIAIDNVTIKDEDGQPAKLNGWVTHNFFKNPKFNFKVTQARDLLCFNVTEKINPIWFGKIYCNVDNIDIDGTQPGLVYVDANVSTAPSSTFTFVLSDKEEASEYTFLTFHDRKQIDSILIEIVEDPVAAHIRQEKQKIAQKKKQQESNTTYRIKIQCHVNENGQMTLVSDPIARDKIITRGTGDLIFEYDSSDEKMNLRGPYKITQGDYSFSIQNLIYKNFKIKNGSTINFAGNPLEAVLNIQAYHSISSVSLSDLDESFLQDRDIRSNNVPVNALLHVTGPLQQLDIKLDLEFPSLQTNDVYRKVRSIINTEDQMSRQIIYLLTLNRFYTPDYMSSTTKGNELVSVASSTLSSQLGSILGQLSNNWSIAPNIKSDKGDFSDTEVNVALSSYLLNNRLLFNGNFGYRDNAMNNSNNSFVGDFDIEYLLNNSGNVRLKAYNRYNDQNYYVKSALTTQGLGIVIKRDFDNIFSFLKKFKKKKDKKTPVPVDSLNTKNANPSDSIDTLLNIH